VVTEDGGFYEPKSIGAASILEKIKYNRKWK
jgi:hypothetical protein